MLEEERDDRASASNHVAVADHGEASAALAGVVVGGDEDFVRAELGGSVKVDRIHGFVGGEGDDLLDAGGDGGVNDVHSAVDVCLYEFVRVVLGGGDLLEGCCVNDVVDVVHGAGESFLVAYVSYEVANLVSREFGARRHVVLLQLVPGEDDDLRRVAVFQQF